MQLPIKSLSRTLFLDIETVSCCPQLSHLEDNIQNLWRKKASFIRRYHENNNCSDEELYHDKAAIYAEFGRVICVSVGYFKTHQGRIVGFKTRSFTDENEASILEPFSQFLKEHYPNPSGIKLVGHNIREFDVPFLCRRMLVNNIDLPSIFGLAGKRPWHIDHIIDTMDLWRFGDYKHYVSLDLLAHLMALPSPKEEVSGDKVGDLFWLDHDLNRIAEYCETDVYTTAMVYLKLNSVNNSEDIVHKSLHLHKL